MKVNEQISSIYLGILLPSPEFNNVKIKTAKTTIVKMATAIIGVALHRLLIINNYSTKSRSDQVVKRWTHLKKSRDILFYSWIICLSFTFAFILSQWSPRSTTNTLCSCFFDHQYMASFVYHAFIILPAHWTLFILYNMILTALLTQFSIATLFLTSPTPLRLSHLPLSNNSPSLVCQSLHEKTTTVSQIKCLSYQTLIMLNV